MEAQFGEKNNFADVVIILVEPQMGENIGAAARLMHNFGVAKLRVVNPRDGWPNERAKTLSVGASFIIDDAIVYTSIEDATKDLKYLYAASARPRFLNKKIFSSTYLSEEDKFYSNIKIGILFGPENSGLSNEHLSLCNEIITIPVNSNYKSLNLAQAVGIICYEISKTKFINKIENINNDLADIGDLHMFFKHLEIELDGRNFFKVSEKKPTMINNLRSIFTRINNLNQQDIKTLRGIVTCLSTKNFKK